MSSNKSTIDNRKSLGRFFRFMLIFIFTFVLIYFVFFLVKSESKARQLQKGIADDIIRFHVIANGNNYNEQLLKYRVKDALVNNLSPLLKDAQSKDQALDIIENRINEIVATANEVLTENGSNNTVSVTITNTYFPLKVYGSYTFPPGNYDALEVKIGKARGENWWCVLFPPLCFVDETYSIVDQETDKQLQFLLTDDEYKEIFSNKDITIKYKFKLWEIFKNFFNKE